MKRNVLTAAEVAVRLGVKIETVYAYVSRGVLRRTLDDDGRTSLFERSAVEALAVRGRPRAGAPRRGSVAVSLVTGITRIEPARLSYRGHDVHRLAERPFEAVAELLWTGRLPDAATWPAPAPRARELSGIEGLVVLAARLAAERPLRADLRLPTVLEHARLLVATFAGGAPVAASLWSTLGGAARAPGRVALLESALVLLADHELATSTMAVRVAASARADPFAAVLAGLGALAGPLHGTAALGCHRLLVDAEARGVDGALALALAAGGVPGFGHPVYAGVDPRAAWLLPRLERLGAARRAALVDAVAARAGASAGAAPNVDFALGAFAYVAGLPVGATETIFAVARTVGFVAHALEEYAEEPLRFRARAIWVGPGEGPLRAPGSAGR